MNKREFLDELAQELSSLSVTERNEILNDYDEHFKIGVESGKSEEEIAENLGSPKELAESYIEDNKLKNENKTEFPENQYYNDSYNNQNNTYNNTYYKPEQNTSNNIFGIVMLILTIVFLAPVFYSIVFGIITCMLCAGIGTITGAIFIFYMFTSASIGFLFIGIGLIALSTMFISLFTFAIKFTVFVSKKYFSWLGRLLSSQEKKEVVL